MDSKHFLFIYFLVQFSMLGSNFLKTKFKALITNFFESKMHNYHNNRMLSVFVKCAFKLVCLLLHFLLCLLVNKNGNKVLHLFASFFQMKLNIFVDLNFRF